MKRIVIIDDELNICNSIQFAVKQVGFECDFFTDPTKGLDSLQSKLPDLVILDIIMPALDGLEICREIRKQSETIPIIFLSSRDDEFDRVLGLELGADDYLCKPFSMKELIARIKVNIRRSELLSSNDTDSRNNKFECGPLVIDEESYTASFCGQCLKLTVTEFRILQYLVADMGMVKTREQLLSKAFPQDYHVNDRAVDTHIKRIRRKLAQINSQIEPIETVFGLGYKFII